MIEVTFEPSRLVAGEDSVLAVRLANTGSETCTDIVFRFRLPLDVLLLRGRNLIEIRELKAGQACRYELLARAKRPGAFAIQSPNFSYRNEDGRPVRVSSFGAELTVVPASQAPATPTLRIGTTGQLALGEWDILRIKVSNSSDFGVRDVEVTVNGPFQIGEHGPSARIPSLAAGAEAEISFFVFAEHGGRHVPVGVRSRYVDRTNRNQSQSDQVQLVVRAAGPSMSATTGKAIILYLAASPTDLRPLRSDKEMREVNEQLQRGKYRDHFELRPALAARLRDITQALLDHEPQIVHFSGHGEPDGGVYVEDELGQSVLTPAAGLARILKQHARTVDCVIVNACSTMLLAEAMAEHFSHVIAMRTAIGDVAAIHFSIGFYQSLAAGRPVPEAFEAGCGFLEAQPPGQQEHQAPALFERGRLATSR